MPEIRMQIADAIATLTIDNAGRRNAINAHMWRALSHAMAQLDGNETLRCVVVRGGGGDFAAGADIEEFPVLRADRASARSYHDDLIAPALRALGASRHPTVACIEGVCLGGGLEIACHCDLRICGASSELGAPIGRLGIAMAPDELAGVLATAGLATTLELLLEGRQMGAAEALAKGLVTRVVDDAMVAQEAFDCARRIAQGAPLAARMNRRLTRSLWRAVATLSSEERAAAFDYVETQDHAEGVRAFLEKRAPRFTGT